MTTPDVVGLTYAYDGALLKSVKRWKSMRTIATSPELAASCSAVIPSAGAAFLEQLGRR